MSRVGRRCLPSVGVESVALQRALEALVELHFQRLRLVVVEPLSGHAVETLVAVEQIAGLVPRVTQAVDVERVLASSVLHDNLAVVGRGIGYLGEADAGVFEERFQLALVHVAHLDDHAGVLREQHLCHIVARQVVQVDMQAAFGVGKGHFEQRGYQAACADVVARHDPSTLDERLDGIEAVGEILRIPHCGHVAADFAEALGQRAAAQPLLVETEINMIEACVLVVDKHRAHHFPHVADLAACADDDRSRRDNLAAIGVLLRKRKRILARWYVDMDGTAEVAQCLNTLVEACVLTFLAAAGPHPVGTEAHRVERSFLVGHRRPHNVGQRFGHREHAAGLRVGQSGLWSVSEGRGDTLAAAVVEGHDATVAQRELYPSLALLARYLARYGAVDLVGQPILAGDGLQLQHLGQVFVEQVVVGMDVGVGSCDGLVHHNGLRGVAEHLLDVEVERLHAVALGEAEVSVARRLAHHIHRRPLAFGDLAHVFEVLLVDEQAHAFLRFVGNHFLGAQRRVADGQPVHVDAAAAVLHQFAQAVQMARRTMVVNADHGVVVLLDKRAHQVVGPLLHFGVGALDGVEFDTVAVTARVHRADGASAQSDTIVIATHDNHLVARLRFFLQTVALLAVAHAACQHDHLVVAVDLSCAVGVHVVGRRLVFEGQYAARDERLAELVAEVAGAIRRLDEYLFGRLVEPLAHGDELFPRAFCVSLPVVVLQPWVSRHVAGRSGDGP